MRQFPLLTLQDILFSKSFNDTKISIYLKECEKHNILWIEGIVTQIYRILTSVKIDPKTKIHSVFLLREVVKTCQYSAIYLVQCYLLPVLNQIAEYYAKNPQFQMNSKYFILQGCNPSYPNIAQLSHNFVVMVSEILYICASIRPKQTFQSQQLKKDSSFYTSLMKIKLKNSKILKDSELQKKLSIPQLKLKNQKQLQQFQHNSQFYVDHYMKKLEDHVFSLQQTRKMEILDFRIVLKKGDVYLTSQAVARVSQMIDFIDDFRMKGKALSIINEMILWGDIQALITVNYTQYFQKIFRELLKIDGSKGLKKGEQIFPEIKNQLEQKKKFYCDFLRCVEVWALSFQSQGSIFYKTQEKSSISPIYKNYKLLRQTRQFMFPENPFRQKMISEIRQSFRNNSERNKLIIDDLNKEVEEVENEYKVPFKQIRESMQNACANLEKLKTFKPQKVNEIQIHALMKFLVKFEHTFQLQLERITENVNDNELDETIEKGLLCIQIINRIQPDYDRFRRGKIKSAEFLSYCRAKIQFTGKNITEISMNSSKSILDRKSELRNSIASNMNKSSTSIKAMTEQTRIKIIRKKYLKRLNKIANNRTNSDQQSSITFSNFNNSKKSLDRFQDKLPLDSMNRQLVHNQTIRQVKSDQKYKPNPLKSPRQTGKKILIVTKSVKDIPSENPPNFNPTNKNLVTQQYQNTNKKANLYLESLKQPPIIQKGHLFSFIKNTPKIQGQYQNDSQSPKEQYQITPETANTQNYENNSQDNRKKMKKGVGLAKQFINLTDKLIAPRKDIISFDHFIGCFTHLKSTTDKKHHFSKQISLINNDKLKVDRLTFFKNQKLIVNFYIFPRNKVQRIRFKISQTPSIYLNVTENKDIKINRNYYELINMKSGQQYSFQISGTLLKTPIFMPQLQIRINQDQYEHFKIPFPLIHMLKFKKPQSKWLSGKDFDLADKFISEEFQRNQDILRNFSDLQDYIDPLVQIKSDKIKKYRTQANIYKTSFLVEFKQVQKKMTISACLTNETLDKSVVEYFINEFMNLFS